MDCRILTNTFIIPFKSKAYQNMLKQTFFVIFLIMSISLVMSPLESAFAIVTSGVVTGGTALTLDGGVFQILTPPIGPVGNDNHQSSNLFAFDETQNVVIPAGGITTDQCFGDVGTCPIPEGTIVASHYVFFDPDPIRTQDGTVDFDSDVYAIISGTANLLASDFLITTNADYQNPGARGIEGADTVSRTGAQQITVDWAASTPGDYIRILTVFSPGGVEVCDGMDNNGDGEIDEGFNVGQACSAGEGECTEVGMFVCSLDGLDTECDAVAGSPDTEVCDGLDNNCDGSIDEDLMCNGLPPTVGGELIPIETTSLILAGAQTFSWMIPVVLSGIGIGLFVFRKFENS